ncbi:PepSY domain-containing protein [Spirillospora sp. CA-255316]
MKRLLVTVVAAGVLAAGGAGAAFAAQDGGRGERDGDGRDGRVAGVRVADVKITAERAAAAALRAVPGRIESLELDDDRDTVVWDADVLAERGGAWREVTVDATTGKVIADRADKDDDGRDDDRGDRRDDASEVTGLRGAKIDAARAVQAALKTAPGTVTSVEFEDGRHWQVDVTGADGRERELDVDAVSGKVTADTADTDDDGTDDQDDD